MSIKKIIKYIVIPIAGIVIIISGFYYGYALFIKKIGISITPREVHAPIEIKHFMQNDKKWKADSMGDTAYTLGSSGCLVCALASVMNKLEVNIDPRLLNQKFNDNAVYDESGEIIWYKIKDATMGIDYKYQKIFGSDTIENDLKQGRLPIVKVKYYKTGVSHWVVITGSNEKDFLIVDSLSNTDEPIELGTHGKIYAYRILVNEE